MSKKTRTFGRRPTLERLEARTLFCGDVVAGIDLLETPLPPISIGQDMLIELVKPEAEQGGSVDPISNPELWPELHNEHEDRQGGSVDPLSNPELWPELHRQHQQQQGGSVDPLSNPELWPELHRQHQQQ
ncbi:MAG: hypothetical protein QF805_11795, partial [Pirellulaceae bacterium]|nr:hypothetical protein [Pirellulaceae bacterium]